MLPQIVKVTAETDDSVIELECHGSSTWCGGPFSVGTPDGCSSAISVSSDDAKASLKSVTIKWKAFFKSDARFLGDALERGYGDLGWKGLEPDSFMPWYFMSHDGRDSQGFGVRTGAAAICQWQVGPDGVGLKLDTRCGSRGFVVGKRTLNAAEIVFQQDGDGKPPFEFACDFVSSLASNPIFPERPVYGFNDWYYAYGRNTEDGILRDTQLCSELAKDIPHRPFSIIDDGWEYSANASSPWSLSSRNFPDMGKLAGKMADMGCLPGIWFRPLLTSERLPGRTINASRFERHPNPSETILDPSIPENLEIVKEDVRRFKEWGYRLVKHDFTAWDIFGKWGFEMRDDITSGSWSFNDRTMTNAEIFRTLYKAIHEASGGMTIIACNAVGHLSVGCAHLNRIGDDTSGKIWSRTRKMGINSLAFRAPQHRSFFMADADCAGITKAIPWRLNAQWLDLLARSGTALFVSAAPDATGMEQKAALKDAFGRAVLDWPAPEPLDWRDGTCPARWRLGGETVEFDWSE